MFSDSFLHSETPSDSCWFIYCRHFWRAVTRYSNLTLVLFHSTFSNGKIFILCTCNQGCLCLSGLCEPNVPFSLNLSCEIDIICSPDVASLLGTSLLSPTTWSPDFTFLLLVVVQSCPTLCDPMDCSTPGLPLLPYFPEFMQTHVHWVGDAIQPSHSRSSPPPPASNPSQHQGVFQWVNSSHEVAKVLEFQLQHESFQWIPRADLLAVQGTLKSLLQHHSSKASEPLDT